MRSMLLFRLHVRVRRALATAAHFAGGGIERSLWTFRRFRRPPGGRRPVGELRRRAAAGHGGARCRSLHDALRTADGYAADTEVRSEESGDVQSGRHVIECAWAVDVAIEHFTRGAISCASNLRVAFCALARKHNIRGTARAILLVRRAASRRRWQRPLRIRGDRRCRARTDGRPAGRTSRERCRLRARLATGRCAA